MLQIETPTLLLDKTRCLRNIDNMILRSTKAGCSLRPHFKTAQSLAIGKWFWERGVRQISVSSLQMAVYFAEGGWDDITVAFPVNILEGKRIKYLSQKCAKLQLLVESSSDVEQLDNLLEKPLGVFIKIDSGSRRSGIAAHNFEAVEKLLERIKICKKLIFKGFLTHAGHSYKARGTTEILAIQQQSIGLMRNLKSRFIKDCPSLILSAGDTPCCSVADDWAEIDELRPGNFTFYDVMQWQIGSCSLDDIAIATACPVVAKHPERLELVLYGGAVHLSKDSIVINGQTIFGLVAKLGKDAWELPDVNNYLRGLSQEHGIAKLSQSFFDEVVVGDVLAILPVHSCLNADLMRAYRDFEGRSYDHFGSYFR